MQFEIMESPYDFMIHQWCVEHRLHLMAEAELKLCGLLWTVLAKLINTWRSPGNAKVLCNAFLKAYDDEERAARIFKRLPTRPISKRWGTSSGTMKFLLQFSIDELIVIFSSIGTTTKKKTNANAVDKDAEVTVFLSQ